MNEPPFHETFKHYDRMSGLVDLGIPATPVLDGFREAVRLLDEITDVIEAYADDHNSDRPTDVTVLLPRLRRALGR